MGVGAAGVAPSEDGAAGDSAFAGRLGVCAARLTTKIIEAISRVARPQMDRRQFFAADTDFRAFAEFMATLPPSWCVDSCSDVLPHRRRIIDQTGRYAAFGCGWARDPEGAKGEGFF